MRIKGKIKMDTQIKNNVSSITNDVKSIRANSPLVHNITNYVVMNTTANALLAIGASPVMAHAEPEIEQMVDIASAIVINIGTLSDSWIKSMVLAGQRANKKNIPIILDPVGVGATDYRTKTAHMLMEEIHPSIIRGNASEIMALAEKSIKTKGVDSMNTSDEALQAAMNLNEIFGSIICISGECDYIVSDKNKDIKTVKRGHSMMQSVTGMGCTASAVCGAFAAVNSDFAQAAANAMTIMGIAGEIAGKKSQGPGSFQMNFLDALYLLDEKTIQGYF